MSAGGADVPFLGMSAPPPLMVILDLGFENGLLRADG